MQGARRREERHHGRVDRGRGRLDAGAPRARGLAAARRGAAAQAKRDREEEPPVLHRTPHLANSLSRRSEARAIAIRSMRPLSPPRGANRSVKSGCVERLTATAAYERARSGEGGRPTMLPPEPFH